MSVDPATLQRFEEARKRRGYPSRSEAFREALRDFVDQVEWARGEGENTLILSVLYGKGPPKAGLASLQHRFDEIRTMLHTHVDELNCLEIFVVEGSTDRLKDLVDRIRKIKGVKQIKFISTAMNL